MLHPRSRLTSSLFATTLFASFFVVVLPHALPCPAPRVVYADGNGDADVSSDGDGIPVKRRRRRKVVVESTSEQRKQGDGADIDQLRQLERIPRTVKRECPVPKPSGLVGEILGFKNKDNGNVAYRDDSSTPGKGERPP
jgi:cytochrome c oxidase assembly factor 2